MKEFLAAWLWLAWACALAAAPKVARTDLSDAFFSNGVVPSLSLQLDASALAALRLHPRAYVKATVSEGPVLYPDVGIHLKGQYGTFQNFEGKPSLTLNFNKFVRGQKFHGLDKVHLNNSVSDPSYLTELLCRELFLAAGLPAGRTSHARVTLNGREAGLYVLVEGHDKSFLRRHFRQTHGNLYDSEFMHDITEPLRKASGDGPDDHSDLQALARACEEPDPDARLAKLGSMVDLDRFYSFLAVELMACHADGYARAKNNYWVYHDPTLSRFVFLPYGMDQMFWQPEGSLIPQLKGVLAEAVLETSPGLDRIRERCAVLFTNHFPRLTNRVEELRARLRPTLMQLGTNALAQHDRAVAQLQQRIGALPASRLGAMNPTESPSPVLRIPSSPLGGACLACSRLRDLQPRAKTRPRLSLGRASPSPLNGERAGVRGGPDPTRPSRSGRSTPHPGPRLDRGGEGARAGRGLKSGGRPRSSAPGRSGLTADSGPLFFLDGSASRSPTAP